MLLHDIRRMKADIILLQETHFRENNLPVLKNRFYPISYHSTYTEAKSRGVSILISARIPWTHTDTQGRYLFLKGQMGDMKVTLANLFVPNDHQDTFLISHLERLMQFSEGQLIVGGDLNIPLTSAEDTSSGTSSTSRETIKCICSALHSAQLVYAWRLSPGGKRLHFLC